MSKKPKRPLSDGELFYRPYLAQRPDLAAKCLRRMLSDFEKAKGRTMSRGKALCSTGFIQSYSLAVLWGAVERGYVDEIPKGDQFVYRLTNDGEEKLALLRKLT